MRKIALALVVPTAFAVSNAAPAQAAITTTNYSFTTGVGSGTFSLDLDSSTSLYSLSALDFVMASGPPFNFGPATFNSSNSGVSYSGSFFDGIGGTVNGTGSVAIGSGPDFFLPVSPGAATQSVLMSYTFGGQAPFPTEATITQLTAIPGSVPEPTSWAMMLVGFGLIGGAMRRRRTRASYLSLKYAATAT